MLPAEFIKLAVAEKGLLNMDNGKPAKSTRLTYYNF